MAIFHNHVSIVSRAKGYSAVGKIAYNHAEKMVNEYDGVVYDYTRKRNVQDTIFLKGKNCPFRNGEAMCQHIEKAEKSDTAQLVREVECSIPIEYMRADGRITERGKKCVEDYVKKLLEVYGMVGADISFHSPPKRIGKNGKRVLARDEKGYLVFENPHAHIILPSKEWDAEKQEWKSKCKKEYLWTDGKDEIYSSEYPGEDKDVYAVWAKEQRSRSKEKKEPMPKFWKMLNEKGNVRSRRVEVSAWDGDGFVDEIRALWAKTANQYLTEDGFSEISHLSNEERGIDIIPQIHLSKYDYHDMQVGKENDAIKKYIAINAYNKAYFDYNVLLKDYLEEVSRERYQSILESSVADIEKVNLRKQYAEARRDYEWLKGRHERVVQLRKEIKDAKKQMEEIEYQMQVGENEGFLRLNPKYLREQRVVYYDEQRKMQKEKKSIFKDISRYFKQKVSTLSDIKELLRQLRKRVNSLAEILGKPKADEQIENHSRGKTLVDLKLEQMRELVARKREQELWEFEQTLKERQISNYRDKLFGRMDNDSERVSHETRMEEVEKQYQKQQAKERAKKVKIIKQLDITD